MFELPLVQGSKRRNRELKVKYRYLRHVVSKFESLSRKSKKDTPQHTVDSQRSLPTPENSSIETEYSSGPEHTEIRRQSERSIGVVARQLEEDDDGYQDTMQEYEDGDDDSHEFHFRKPEMAYEIWNTSKKHRVPLNRKHINYRKYEHMHRYAARRTRQQVGHLSRHERWVLEVWLQGNEILQREDSDLVPSYTSIHISKLVNLLHITMSREQWDLAYRTFALLIRIPGVDLRSLWGSGARILKQKSPEESLRFLEWMNNVYSCRNVHFVQSRNYRLDPVFRSGSRTHTPKYAITWLWDWLLDCTRDVPENDAEFVRTPRVAERLDNIIERISELVLVPPFMDDPEIWYLYAVCHMVKADVLAKQLAGTGLSLDIARSQVAQHVQFARTHLGQCVKRDPAFYVPENMSSHLSALEMRLFRTEVIHEELSLDTQTH